MTTFLIIEIAAGIALIAVLAHLIKGWEERDRYPEDPLFPLRAKELCDDMHQWESAAFLNRSQIAQARENPKLLDQLKVTFCTKCGYIPAFQKMVKPLHLQRLRAELAYSRAVRKRMDQIEEAEEQYWQLRLKDLPKDVTSSERIYFRMGYNAHSTFVDELPQIVAKLDSEAVAGLETPGSLPDASGI